MWTLCRWCVVISGDWCMPMVGGNLPYSINLTNNRCGEQKVLRRLLGGKEWQSTIPCGYFGGSEKQIRWQPPYPIECYFFSSFILMIHLVCWWYYRRQGLAAICLQLIVCYLFLSNIKSGTQWNISCCKRLWLLVIYYPKVDSVNLH